MNRAKRFCRWPGCGALTGDPSGYCDEHRGEWERKQQQREARRGSARQRGYDARWERYSRWFLSLPQNQFCALRLDEKCNVLAQCVDHIDPPDSPGDPRFWDPANHQPACIHCNSVKGHRRIVGKKRF